MTHPFVVHGGHRLIILIVLVGIALPVLYSSLPHGADWSDYYRPAALAMLRGENPYKGYGYYNPPWTLLPFIPIALLPARLGRLVIFLISLVGFGLLMILLRAKPLAMILFLSSAPVFGCLHDGNLDWLPMLSMFLPPAFGLMLAVTKPQVGLGMGIYWLVESWRAGGLRTVVPTFLPVTLLVISWPLLYDLQLVHFRELMGVGWNMSIFPYGLPVGIYLLWSAIAHTCPGGRCQGNSKTLSLASSPFFSPYFEGYSLVSLLTALLEHPWRLGLAWVCLWTYKGILAVLSP